MDVKELEKTVQEQFSGLKADLQKEFGSKGDELKKELEGKLEGLKELTSKEDVDKSIKAIKDSFQEQFNELATKVNKMPVTSNKNAKVSFKDVLGNALEDNRDTLSNMVHAKGSKANLELKVVGDMTFSNFGTGAYESITTEDRPGLYQSPFSPLWLRNILPNASTDKSTIDYIKENGGEGAAAVWADDASVKPQVDHDFVKASASVDWIAGYTKIYRSMLDDVSWLRGYLSQQLVFGRRGIYVAENAEILSTLDANSTAYDGVKTNPVERMYEAALGQLRDEYFNPSYILMNHRDFVNFVAFNKASGSGEYDLPVGTVVIDQGRMSIGGVPVIGVPNIASGSFYAIDNTQTQFVSRMSPEVRFFDQNEDDAKRNLIMVRAEERIATLVFNSAAVIKGTVEAGT